MLQLLYLIFYLQLQESVLLEVLLFYLAERINSMESMEAIISTLDYLLNTKRKRHITGGILLSISMLFSGLAITVMTIKNEGEDR